MAEIIDIDSISDYCHLYGIDQLHPDIAVVDMRKATRLPNHLSLRFGLYGLFLKNNESCVIHYGRQKYDYQAGTVVNHSPGEAMTIERVGEADPDVFGLVFHPDLLLGTPLAANMRQYTYFSYDKKEALHLSDAERGMFVDGLKRIDSELHYPADRHSRKLLAVQVETLLDYCLRFYDRQFETRHKVDSTVLMRFEQLLDNYFSEGKAHSEGLPTVKYFADHSFLSPGYFGDLIKKETGKSAQDYIHDKIISESKTLLMSTDSNVNQVADQLGFQYPQHFIRFFKRKVGCTPGVFKRHNLMD